MKKKATPKSKAWNAFSEYIRLKYADSGGMVKCVTCGTVQRWKGDGMQAGHYIDGRNNTVLLDERLVYPQCTGCNFGKNGNKNNYTFFMLEQGYTVDELKEFEALRHKVKKIKKFEWEELEEMYKEKANYIRQEKEL